MSLPSIRELVAQYSNGSLTPADVISSCWERFKLRNPALNAFSHQRYEEALHEARRLYVPRAPRSRKALFGVPFSVKENIDLKGSPIGLASALIPRSIAPQSMGAVQQALRHGALAIGKGTMPEYGKSYYTDSVPFGRTNNPFDHSRSPGGSSGGDAVAVSEAFCSFAIAADSGGSIRVPANFCGIFGLFPTIGTISEAGSTFPPTTVSVRHRGSGPLARSLDDLATILSCIAGFDPLDPRSLPPAPSRSSRAKARRVVFFTEMNGVRCDPAIAQAVREVAARAAAAGYDVREETPEAFAHAYECFIILAGQAALSALDASRDPAWDRSAESPIMQHLRRRIANELPPLTPETLMRAWSFADALRIKVSAWFSEVACVIAPVAACLPPAHGTSQYIVDGQTLASQQVFQFASCVNLLGLPALATPVTWHDGLPVGVQLVGPRLSDRRLLALAREWGLESIPVRSA